MRCPPGLVFDDSYQRCEWPGANAQNPSHRLGSLRNKKQQMRKISTMKQQQATFTVSPTKKFLNP